MRVPFLNALSPHQFLSTGKHLDPCRASIKTANALCRQPPGNTLGSSATQWGNIDLIFERPPSRQTGLSASGGMAFLLPTGPDQTYQIIDYTSTPASLQASGQRERSSISTTAPGPCRRSSHSWRRRGRGSSLRASCRWTCRGTAAISLCRPLHARRVRVQPESDSTLRPINRRRSRSAATSSSSRSCTSTSARVIGSIRTRTRRG